jgi:hypothetical protein
MAMTSSLTGGSSNLMCLLSAPDNLSIATPQWFYEHHKYR